MTEITSRLSTALADRYRIERELGAGGMATVYLAEDLKHERKVAVKNCFTELSTKNWWRSPSRPTRHSRTARLASCSPRRGTEPNRSAEATT